VHFAPATAIAGGGVHQLPEQSRRVDPIRFRAAGATVDRNAGGVHHDVVHGMRVQRAVQPEGLAAGLVATPYRRIRWQVESALRGGDLLEQTIEMARRHRADARLRVASDAERELPRGATEVER
jgi:hypothetical protein